MIGYVNLGLILSVTSVLIVVIVRIESRERRLSNIETAITYLRRDLDQILKLYRLTPVEEQEKRRRR